MATFKEKYGWEWTTEERQERQSPLRRARNLLSRIQQQTFRTGQHLPQFKAEAQQALRQLQEGLREVAGMDLSNRGRKYHRLSPEEFDRALNAIPELMKPWERLAASPEYAAAVRQKNREIRAHNRIVPAQNAAMFREMDAIMRLADSGDLGGALDLAAKKGLL